MPARRIIICGLVGVAGDITQKDEKVFKNLLILDILRGEHSTGMAAVNRSTNDVSVVKQVGNTFELFNDKRFDRALQGWQHVLMGHNRYATVGAVSKANAHPFKFDHIVGAHNGTLTSRHNLIGQKDFVTDSEALYNHVNEKGIVDAMANCSGAYALTWWDSKEKTINFLRNDERTLFIAMSTSGKSIYWASEAWMLEAALSRNAVLFETPVSLTEDSWMSIVIDGGKLEKPRFRKVESPKFVSQFPIHQHGIGTTKTAGINKFKGAVAKTHSLVGSTNKISHLPPVAPGLMGAKNVLFELRSKAKDENGGIYFSCVDPTNKQFIVRFYVNRREEYRFEVGDLVQADVNQWKDGYYKLSNSSVSLIEIPSDTEAEDELKYADCKGNLLSKKDWKRKYSDCAWCSSPLDPDDDNEMSKDGNVICPACASEEEVKQYIIG